MHRVVIVGGGFGGLYAARALRRAPVDVTLIDKRNFHLFQPLLYQVATGGLSPANIAAPLRGILKRQKNARVLLGEVSGFDVGSRRVRLADGPPAGIEYDTLIVGTGVRHNYFGHAEWEPLAPGLKTIEDATAIRRRILLAFEAAERAGDPAEAAAWLTFVVVGAGPTGVELAGALAEIARDTLKHDFRTINPADARILLLDAVERVLPSYAPDLSEKAARSLARLGVTVRTRAIVTGIHPDAVIVRSGEQTERIAAHTVLWAAGVQASPLGAALAQATGAQLDRAGRLIVEPGLTLP
ncbi:MAG: NAD(P)/FAD-dependent oxidoreductase, partial [Dongiaceae bacterium]